MAKVLTKLPTQVSPMFGIIQTFRKMDLNSTGILLWTEKLTPTISSIKNLVKAIMDGTPFDSLLHGFLMTRSRFLKSSTSLKEPWTKFQLQMVKDDLLPTKILHKVSAVGK